MFKRVRWVAMGFGAGIGATVYAYLTVRKTVDRHTTPELRDAGRRVNALRRDLQAAVSEGRSAMQEREAELNAQIAGGQVAGSRISGDRGAGETAADGTVAGGTAAGGTAADGTVAGRRMSNGSHTGRS